MDINHDTKVVDRKVLATELIRIPSVCLPRVYHKFDANYVEGIFCDLFGQDMYGNSCVEKVDMVSRTDRNTGEPFHVVFIHFSDHMYYSDYLGDFAARIGKDEEVKIHYKPPWFWNVRKNKSANRKEVRTGPRIMTRNDEAEIMAKQQEIAKAQKLRKDTNEEMYNHEAETTKLGDVEDEEDEEWPPPIEWGEDADTAEVR